MPFKNINPYKFAELDDDILTQFVEPKFGMKLHRSLSRREPHPISSHTDTEWKFDLVSFLDFGKLFNLESFWFRSSGEYRVQRERRLPLRFATYNSK